MFKVLSHALEIFLLELCQFFANVKCIGVCVCGATESGIFPIFLKGDIFLR